MPDLYLQALMQGQILKKNIKSAVTKEEKNRFELETEKQINAYAASLNFDEDPAKCQFNTPEMKRAKVVAELKEEAKLSELSGFIEKAFKILTSEGEKYLNSEQFKAMNADFIAGNEALEEIDLDAAPTANFQTLMHFSDPTIESIFNIAVAKYNESLFTDSLSIFILLSILAPENPDYWLRAGILAHKSENYELATRLYTAATELDPVLPSPWIFSIDCYLKRDMPAEADTAYAEVIKINEASPIEDSLIEMLSQYKVILNKS